MNPEMNDASFWHWPHCVLPSDHRSQFPFFVPEFNPCSLHATVSSYLDRTDSRHIGRRKALFEVAFWTKIYRKPSIPRSRTFAKRTREFSEFVFPFVITLLRTKSYGPAAAFGPNETYSALLANEVRHGESLAFDRTMLSTDCGTPDFG